MKKNAVYLLTAIVLAGQASAALSAQHIDIQQDTTALATVSPYAEDKRIPYNEITLFSVYDSLLQSNVRGTKVYIQGFDSEPFRQFLTNLALTEEPRKKDSSAYRAFWLNAFNASVLTNIVRTKGLLMTNNKEGFYSKDSFLIAGKYITLDAMRDSILRPFSQGFPFVHFGLWYGCESSPKLHNRAFVAATCDAELRKLAKIYLKGPTGALLDIGANVLNLPFVFNDFSVDFGWTKKSVFNFVAPLLRDTEGAYLAVHHQKIELGYREWNWKIPETKTPSEAKEIKVIKEQPVKSSPTDKKKKK